MRWLFVAISLFVSRSALAADLYVDASAAAGGDGTAGMPMQEIQDALALAQPGDTIHVADGTYAPIQSVRDGAADARITVVADNPLGAIVQGDGNALRNEHDYHTYDGLVIDGNYGQVDLVLGESGDHAEYLNLEVRRSGRDCFDLRIVEDVLIAGCNIHHCVSLDQDGVINDGHGVTGDSVFGLTIRDTTIHMASGDSVQLSPPREPWGDLLIEGCTFSTAPLDDPDAGVPMGSALGENALDTKVGADLDGRGANPRVEVRDTIAFGFSGFITNQGAFNMKEDVDATIDGVTVYDTEVAFRLRFPANVAVYNAVVWGVDNVIRYEDGLAGARFVNATIGEGIGADVFEDGGGGGQMGMVLDNVLVLGDALPPLLEGTASMLAGDDQFVDAAGHDYRLVEGAAAIDVGTMYAEVASDRIGVARPYGDAWDVGAFEWSPAGAEDTGDVDSSGGVDDSGSGSESASGSASASGSGSDSATASGSDGATEAGSEGSAGMGDGSGGDGCNCNTGASWHSAIVGLLFATAFRRRRR